MKKDRLCVNSQYVVIIFFPPIPYLVNVEKGVKSFMKKNKKAQGNKMDGRPLFGAVFSCEKEGTGNISFICSRHTD